MREEQIIQSFVDRFPALQDRIYAVREKRIFTKALSAEEFVPIITYAKQEAGFTRALHVVGTDDGEQLGFLYLLINADNVILALRETAPKTNPVIPTMTTLFPALLWHERELVDLFGAVITGLPEGPNYPLPDGWPAGNYPMRKEWNPDYFDRQTMTYREPAANTEVTPDAK